jgi:hypothetical protein
MKILLTGVRGGIGVSLGRLFRQEEVWGRLRRRRPGDLRIRFGACDGLVVIDANGLITQQVREIPGLVYRSVGRPRTL